eukprot:3078866-Prymnesium_polylepis.1
MNLLRDSIKSKMDESERDRIKVALKMLPKTHICFDYINPLIVVQPGRDGTLDDVRRDGQAAAAHPPREGRRERCTRPGGCGHRQATA